MSDILIRQKLKSDIREHFSEKYDIYKEFIDHLIDEVSIDYSMKNKNHYRKEIVCHKERCSARLWNDHYGGRCSFQIKENGLCQLHSNIMKNKGSLPFGTVNDKLPIRDKNGNILKWYNVSDIKDHIDCIVQENRRRLFDCLDKTLYQTLNIDKL